MKLINLALQTQLIQKKCPNWFCFIKNSKLTCKGNIKPFELSNNYIVKIVYILRNSPELTIIDPPLQTNSAGERPPHLYEGELLCLYHPWKNEWDGSKVIAETIIPWISLWLYFYEAWLVTGEWKGGGEHPTKHT